jgi:hypothetical protein
MLYSKNGSIPKPETDGTDGWIEVPDAPECPEGKEVVWWFPPGWVIRDLKPEAEEGFVWSWSQSEEQWVKYDIRPPAPPVEEQQIETITSADIPALTSSDISAL